MCLTTNKKKVSIAKRDKTVFKWIGGDKKTSSTTWVGPIYDCVDFPFNEIVTAKDSHGKEIDHLQLRLYYQPGYGYIEEGIHSYRIYSLKYLDSYHKICVIPKGSEYCYGVGGEVVSKEIIVFSSFKEYFRYKWKKLLEKKS